MLKSISLENYKCFKEKTDIEIAPLTVLCGLIVAEKVLY